MVSAEGQAFILVIAAGLCTTIGSCVVFFPQMANLANRTTLGGSLGLAAGVMLYIALVDIYTKSIGGFEEVHDEGKAFIYATLSFFAGCFLMLALDKLVDVLMEWEMSQHGKGKDSGASHVADVYTNNNANQGEDLEKMREDFKEKVAAEGEEQNEEADAEKQSDSTDLMDTTDSKNAGSLRHMGFAMALAIAIHNFPEGMVTYIAYVEDPGVGIALAVGIAVHNIPEGLCVSMPLYYATGRRMYSFLWGTLSGLTEPIGALIAWLVLRNSLGGNANGILFGLVSGMMTVISVAELLPSAHRYAPTGNLVTYSFLVGAFFIALSLMMFSV